MPGYLVRRAATYLLVLVAAVAINFFLPRAMPGDPLEQLTSGVGSLAVVPDPATLEALKQYYGLDRPLGEQFLHYVQGLARGELGFSIAYKVPVAELIAARLPWTLFLSCSAVLLSSLLAIILGTKTALGQTRESAVLLPAVILDSIPPFVLGSLLLILLGVKLRIFPLSGAYTAFVSLPWWQKIPDILWHAALPVLVLTAHGFFGAYLVVRNSVRLVKEEAYVLMAEVKGLPHRVVRYRYILATALLPVVTYFALRLGRAIGGAILIEVIFAYPGLGRLTYEAVLANDYPVLQGVFFVFTLWFLSVNLLTDLLYLKLDPRIREV